MTDDEKFGILIDGLRPALSQAVIIGGWAHRLHRLLPSALHVEHAPVFTTDTDIAVGQRSLAGIDLRTRLADRGFTEDFLGTDTPPVVHYSLGRETSGFYAEFLTPLSGAEFTRRGTRDVTARVGGVIAQKLRYLEVLLMEPRTVELPPGGDFALSERAGVLIPNPVCYIAQKLLINGRRKPYERVKDLLYIHDTIELFGGTLGDLATFWRAEIAPRLHKNQRRQVVDEANSLFGQVNDLNRSAAMLASDRTTPSLLQSRTNTGLKEIFAI